MRNDGYCCWSSRSLLPSWFCNCHHNQINDLLCRAFTSSATLSTRERHSLCNVLMVTIVPWKSGRCLAWDATCPDTYAQTNCLQLVLNSAARAVTKTPKFHHRPITPNLKSLPWLKINERMKYKVLSRAYKSLKTGQPFYLRSLPSFPSNLILISLSFIVILFIPMFMLFELCL